MAYTPNKLVRATGNNTTETYHSVNTTVGDPGVDTALVTEQGIREALDALTAGLYEYKNFIIDNPGSAIPTGAKGPFMVPAGTIVAVRLLADQTGSIKIDLWKDSFANYPPTDADSICGGNEPEITNDDTYEDTTLTGWTTTLAADDIIMVNVDSCTTIERCSVILKIQRT